MVKRVSTAEAKAHFAALLAEAAAGGMPTIIERRRKPLAVLVGIAAFERGWQGQLPAGEPKGALALAGAWREVEDEEIESLVADIYARREQEQSRPVELEV